MTARDEFFSIHTDDHIAGHEFAFGRRAFVNLTDQDLVALELFTRNLSSYPCRSVNPYRRGALTLWHQTTFGEVG